MDLNLKKNTVNFFKVVYGESKTHEETAEIIVPDILPDIARILDTGACVMLRSKEAEDGSVTVAGTVNAQTVYVSDSGEVKKVDISIPFSDVREGQDITSASRVIVKAQVISVDSQMLNPRKIIVRADILLEIKCFNGCSDEIPEKIDGENTYGIDLLSRSKTVRTVTEVSEKTFVISDEFRLPSSKPPLEEILKSNVRLESGEAKSVGKKLILKGTAFVDVLYRSERNGEIAKAEFSTVFSQILEMNNTEENTLYDVQLMMTGLYLSVSNETTSGDYGISMELHAVAQCAAANSIEYKYIADTNSSHFLLKIEKESISFDDIADKIIVTEILRDTLKTSIAPRNILETTVRLGTVSKSSENTRVPVTVTVIYISEDGRIISIAERFTVEIDSSLCAGFQCSVDTKCGDELYITASEAGFDIRIPIECTFNRVRTETVGIVKSISFDEESRVDLSDKPSLIIYRMNFGDTLWSLSKKYYSSSELILNANNIENENEIKSGDILIIPKKK